MSSVKHPLLVFLKASQMSALWSVSVRLVSSLDKEHQNIQGRGEVTPRKEILITKSTKGLDFKKVLCTNCPFVYLFLLQHDDPSHR